MVRHKVKCVGLPPKKTFSFFYPAKNYWDWRLQECTALPASVAWSTLGRLDYLLSHIHLGQPEKSAVAEYSITRNIITNSEHWNPLHQILLHGPYREGSNWNWVASFNMKRDGGLVFSRSWKPLIHPRNKRRKAPCEDTAQHYSLFTRPHISTLSPFLVTSVNFQWLHLLATSQASSLCLRITS